MQGPVSTKHIRAHLLAASGNREAVTALFRGGQRVPVELRQAHQAAEEVGGGALADAAVWEERWRSLACGL